MVKRTPDELAAHFSALYDGAINDAERELEREALGTEWGNTSWTTREQADELVELLGVGPGDRVMDLGAGRGWLGRYVSTVTGADVVLVDRPIEGLSSGPLGRGARTVLAVAATGEQLPFRPASFAAIVHTDVLC